MSLRVKKRLRVFGYLHSMGDVKDSLHVRTKIPLFFIWGFPREAENHRIEIKIKVNVYVQGRIGSGIQSCLDFELSSCLE